MGREKWTDDDVGQRIKGERERRGWSQANMARMLSRRGIEPMHATTVAKIEAGSRSLRVTEAVGIADLFEISVDTLLGRHPVAEGGDLLYRLRMLRDTAQKLAPQSLATAESIREQIMEMPKGFEGSESLRALGISTVQGLFSANDALLDLANRSHDVLQDQQERGVRPAERPSSQESER